MRSWSSCRSLAGLAVAGAIVIAAAGGSDAQGPGPAVRRQRPSAAAPSPPSRPRAARRARRLRVNAAAFGTLLRADGRRAPALVLNLFADVELAVVRERLEHGRRGHTSWIGHVEGDASSTVALTWDGHTLSGGVVTGGRRVRPDARPATALVVVAERDARAAACRAASPDAPGGARDRWRCADAGRRWLDRRRSTCSCCTRRPPGPEPAAPPDPVAARQRRRRDQHRLPAQRRQRRAQGRGHAGSGLRRRPPGLSADLYGDQRRRRRPIPRSRRCARPAAPIWSRS